MVGERGPTAAAIHAKKCPEIQNLDSYDRAPPSDFWLNFPSLRPSFTVQEKIDSKELKKLVKKHESSWTSRQRADAAAAVKAPTQGATTVLKYKLGPLEIKNAASAIVHGVMMTDTITA